MSISGEQRTYNHHHLGTQVDGSATIVNSEGLAPIKNSSLEMARVISIHNSGCKYSYGPNISWRNPQGRQKYLATALLIPKGENMQVLH